MPLPDLTNPVVSENIAQFSGDGRPNPAAKINYDVPLPGSYSFDRIVPLRMPFDAFADGSLRRGSSLIELGVVQGDETVLNGINRENLARFYRRMLPIGARPSLRNVARVGGDVEPLLTEAAGRRGARAAAGGPETFDPLERRRIVAEPEDVEVQRLRTDSYLMKLSEEQANLVSSAGNRAEPRITLPVAGAGQSIQEISIDPVARPMPRIALVETWELRADLGDYGLGRTLQTFSLLPGERTTITMQSWRSDAATREDASSVFDSSDVAAQTRFASSVASETGAVYQDQGGWAMSASVSGSAYVNGFGLVGAETSFSSGFAANHQESSRVWSQNIRQASESHASQVNSSRRQAVMSTSATTTASGSATTTVRELTNTNLRRVLNFVFRELNQTYRTRVVLRDIKVAFYNGRFGSVDVAPLGELRPFLERHVAEGRRMEVARQILSLCAERLGSDGNVISVLQRGKRGDRGPYQWEQAWLDGQEIGDHEPLADGVRWRFGLDMDSACADRQVRGLITDMSEVVLRTDSMVVEALLGQADALDPYASAMQALDLEARQAETATRQAETRRVTDALDMVAELAKDGDRIDAWTKVFPDNPDIEVVPVASVSHNGNP